MNYCCKMCPAYDMRFKTGWHYGGKIWETMPWDNMQHGPRCEQTSDTSDAEDVEMAQNEWQLVKNQPCSKNHEPSSSGGTNSYNEAFGRSTVNQPWKKTICNAFQKDVKGETMKISKGDTNTQESEQPWDDHGMNWNLKINKN